MSRCKACEVVRNEAYFSVRCNDEQFTQRRRWVSFNSLIDETKGVKEHDESNCLYKAGA
jgi:hypothetical protein